MNNMGVYANLRRLIRLKTAAYCAGILAVSAAGVQAQTTNAPPPWDLSVALGLTGTRGNSDTVLFSLTSRADKKWGSNELHLGADAVYGEQNDIKNNESFGAFAQYNRLFAERWYGYLRVDGLHDGIADVAYRFNVGPGIGYYFIKNASTSLSVEGGPGIVFEKQGGISREYYTARIGEKFEHKFNDRVRVWQSAEFLPQVDNIDNFILNTEAGVESALSKSLALRLVLQDSYDNQPAAGRDSNDVKLIASLAWKLVH